MRSHNKSSVWRLKRGRSGFGVAPPQRYVINRMKQTSLPHNLSVIVVLDPNMVELTAFLQPIAALPKDEAGNTENAIGTEDKNDSSNHEESLEHITVPSFFRVNVYVWEDTTLREILEEVLFSCSAARAALLPAPTPPETDRKHPSNPNGDTKESNSADVHTHDHSANNNEDTPNHDNGVNNGDVDGAKDANNSTDEEEPEEEEEEKGDKVDDEAEGGPRKRARLEKESANEKGIQPGNNDMTEARRRWMHRRRVAVEPMAKVGVSHVFVDTNGRPCIDALCVLRVDQPIFHAGDTTTLQEMRNRKGGKAFKNGDLIILAPTVRHYRPTSTVAGEL